MKRTFLIILVLCILTACASAAFADQTHKNPVYELYSVDGYYVDDVGNEVTYSYHVPQIYDATPDAEEINSEIAGMFGSQVESHFGYMEKGTSLSSSLIEWDAYWNGNQLFLLITAKMIGDVTDYAAYGYDFETGNRVTNEMILEQKGISEEEYMENLRETVRTMFEDVFVKPPAGVKTETDYDTELERTLGWLSMDLPMFINQYGEIVTIVEIITGVGAGLNQYLAISYPVR